MSLLPVPLGERGVIVKNGWKVVVSIHDQGYLDERARWKRRLAASHPDRGGRSVRTFLRTYATYRRWLTSERIYYSTLNLLPPKWTSREEEIISTRSEREVSTAAARKLLPLVEVDQV